MVKMRRLYYIAIYVLFSILLCALLVFVFQTQCENFMCFKESENQPVVKSASGVFRGTYNVTRLGRRFESYRGIRYAEPPVGELRFQPPILIEHYEESVDATKDGYACPQPLRERYPIFWNYMNEDCLTINVYTPLKVDRTGPLPVVVFIHESAFAFLSSHSELCGPNYLLDRNLVLVTFNYRLGPLGYISTGDKNAPGNNGFKDQVVALKWVQKNIAEFGGDPDCVTISGYSSGSSSVMLHMVSPMSKGLFHRAISMGGSAIGKVKMRTELYDSVLKLAQLFKCPTDNSTVIIRCLKNKPWKDYVVAKEDFYVFGGDPVHSWQSVVEIDSGLERFLPLDPLDVVRSGEMNDVPYIISQNEAEILFKAYYVLRNASLRRAMNEEWERFAPISLELPRENRTTALKVLRSTYLKDRPLQDDEDGVHRLGTLYSDSIIAFPVSRLANLMCRHLVNPVWYFEFSYVGNHSYYENPVTGKPSHAVHQDELIYLLSRPYLFPEIRTTGMDSVIVQRMTAIFYNFARYGDPNPRKDTPELKGLEWPAMKPDNRTYLRMSDQMTLHQNLKEDRLRIWEQLYPIEY